MAMNGRMSREAGIGAIEVAKATEAEGAGIVADVAAVETVAVAAKAAATGRAADAKKIEAIAEPMESLHVRGTICRGR